MVMVLVQTQRSMTDVCEISPSNTSKLMGPSRPATLGHPPYVVGPVRDTMRDNEAESQHSRALQSHGGQEHGLYEDIMESV